jgi:hypothetical protein
MTEGLGLGVETMYEGISDTASNKKEAPIKAPLRNFHVYPG